MSTINKEQAEDLDLILRHLQNKEADTYISIREVHKFVLNNKTFSYCKALFTILSSNQPSLIKYIEEIDSDDIIFRHTNYISTFLQEGGYTKRNNTEEEKNIREKEREELSFNKLQDDAQISKGKRITFWLTFSFALVSFLYVIMQIIPSIIDFIKTHFNK